MIEGRAFLLQAGDCVESFNELSTVRIREKLKIMLQMSAVLTYGATLPVVKVGRIAGQFVKPRSEATDADGLPSFRGHMIHDDARTEAARVPDPRRMVEGYNQSAATLNLLRAFTKGGYADLTQVHLWNQEFVASSPEGRRYERLAHDIERALQFMAACGIDLAQRAALHEVDVFTSHEGLLLDYEEGLTRKDSLTGDWYDCSAHMLWIGERTRQLDGAHVEFFSGVHNPIGVKLGPTATPDEVVELCERLNPDRLPGRLTFVARMGAENVQQLLPPLSRPSSPRSTRCSGRATRCTATRSAPPTARKTRRFDAVMTEIEGFFAACWAAGVRPGGVHLEFTGDGRDGVPRRRRRRARVAALVALRDALRPAPERAPVARPGVPPRRADAARAALTGRFRRSVEC